MSSKRPEHPRGYPAICISCIVSMIFLCYGQQKTSGSMVWEPDILICGEIRGARGEGQPSAGIVSAVVSCGFFGFGRCEIL